MPRLCRMKRSGPTIGGLALDLCQNAFVKASIPTVGCFYICIRSIAESEQRTISCSTGGKKL